jgi:hypothetical protein
MQQYDTMNTQFVQPQYNTIVINIMNGVRIIYDGSWCWYNAVAIGMRDLRKVRVCACAIHQHALY